VIGIGAAELSELYASGGVGRGDSAHTKLSPTGESLLRNCMFVKARYRVPFGGLSPL
jgi:hypothetical protein